jgi:hypothetical protein
MLKYKNSNLPAFIMEQLLLHFACKKSKLEGISHMQIQGVYTLVHKRTSPTEMIFPPLPVIRQNIFITHPFWLYFCPFCIYFTLFTSISPLPSFFLFPSHFPLFSRPPLHIPPPQNYIS